jgi:hypothetical protein
MARGYPFGGNGSGVENDGAHFDSDRSQEKKGVGESDWSCAATIKLIGSSERRFPCVLGVSEKKHGTDVSSKRLSFQGCELSC